MDDLSRCVLMNVLSRLPVISILRFRSVSKFWLETIDDPSFRSLLKLKETMILGLPNEDWKLTSRIYSITSRGPGMVAKEMREFYGLYGYRFKNSCNGLLYFETWLARKQLKSMVVNPFTGKIVNVPNAPERMYNDRVERALGFDNSTGTFKLVELSSKEWTGEGLGGATYNFKTRCWTPCKAPECPSHMLQSYHIHASSETGTLYWITSYHTSTGFFGPLILSFDMEKEEFLFIRFPHRLSYLHMIELNGRLTLCDPFKEYINIYELVDRRSHNWGEVYRIPRPHSCCSMDLCAYSTREILIATPPQNECGQYNRRGTWTKWFYLYDTDGKEWKSLGEVIYNGIWISVDCVKQNLTLLDGP